MSAAENPIKRLRDELGLSQSDFARLLGKSFQSVRIYEKTDVEQLTSEVRAKVIAIAAEKGFADIALELTPGNWSVEKVVYPSGHAVHPGSRGKHKQWHDLLDTILDSNDPDAVPAVQSNLLTFSKYVHLLRSKAKPQAHVQKKA